MQRDELFFRLYCSALGGLLANQSTSGLRDRIVVDDALNVSKLALDRLEGVMGTTGLLPTAYTTIIPTAPVVGYSADQAGKLP